MLFPEPANNADGDQSIILEEYEGRTFAIDPQECASGLPFCEYTALREPLGRPSMVEVARDVMIRRWIGWSNPFSKALSQLIPYEQIRNTEAQ